MGFKHVSLFSGIGGFDYAAELMGWTNIASCEINPFGRKILEYYWPNAYHHDDIHTLTKEIFENEIQKRFGSEYRTEPVILTGGFPCQPFSIAGKRKGTDDDRHLWPEMLRVIREISPDWIVGENVRGIVSWDGGLVFDQVLIDLEAQSYKVFPIILPACGVNAPHRRERVWFVAYSKNNRKGGTSRQSNGESQKERLQKWDKIQQPDESNCVREFTSNTESVRDGGSASKECENIGEREFLSGEQERRKVGSEIEGCGSKRAYTNANSELLQRRCSQIGPEFEKQYTGSFFRGNAWQNFPTQSPICDGDDGISTRLDGITFSKWRKESIKGGGNAVVPQVVLQIFKTIEKMVKDGF